MRDVAKLAGGVSPSTVSLALRDSPRISRAARARIHAAAKKIGYRRDPLLDAFNQHRLKNVSQPGSRHLAAVSDFSSMAELNGSPLHAAARVGALETAARLHCHLDFFFCGPGQPTARRLDAVFKARGLRALLLFGVRADSATMNFTWADKCAVAIDSLRLTTPLYRVTPDYREATRLLWRSAWTQGCQRIAIIRSDCNQPSSEDRAIAGFLLEQFRHPQAPPIPFFPLTGERSISARFIQWLQRHRPQVILHSTGATNSLLPLIGNAQVRRYVYDAPLPSIAGVYPDYAEVGRRAVEQLVTLIQTNQLGIPPAAVCTYVAVNLPP
jgi:LacI family transcriptional regulator